MMKIPLWFKIWFAFCALVGVALVGVATWVVIRLVNYYT